jgi:polyadenylate-binding protein
MPIIMMADYDIRQPEADHYAPQPHPYLHEPILYISNLPPYMTDQNLVVAFVSCRPFRPKIPRDGSNMPLSGTIEFKLIEKGEY